MVKWGDDPLTSPSRFDDLALPIVVLFCAVMFGMVAVGMVRGYNDVYEGRTTVTTEAP